MNDSLLMSSKRILGYVCVEGSYSSVAIFSESSHAHSCWVCVFIINRSLSVWDFIFKQIFLVNVSIPVENLLLKVLFILICHHTGFLPLNRLLVRWSVMIFRRQAVVARSNTHLVCSGQEFLVLNIELRVLNLSRRETIWLVLLSGSRRGVVVGGVGGWTSSWHHWFLLILCSVDCLGISKCACPKTCCKILTLDDILSFPLSVIFEFLLRQGSLLMSIVLRSYGLLPVFMLL